MDRWSWVIGCVLVVSSCGGPRGPAAPTLRLVTTDPSATEIVIVNRTAETIESLTFHGYNAPEGTKPDEVKQSIPPGGRASFRLKTETLRNNELAVTVLGAPVGRLTYGKIIAGIKPMVSFTGPTELVISDTKEVADPPTPGYTRVVKLSVDGQKKADDRYTSDRRAEAEQQCQRNIDGANGTPRPGKTKAQGRFKCVFGGSFDGNANVTLVQLANGKITATVSEAGGSRIASTTWTGIVDGDMLRFAYAGLPSGGALKIDPGGRAMIGHGTTLDGNVCVNWTMTCTR
jgi:hypothetical protein